MRKKQLKDFAVKEDLVPFPVRLPRQDLDVVLGAGYNVSEILRAALKETAGQVKKRDTGK